MKILVFFAGLLISMSAVADTSQLKLDLILAKRGDVSAQFSVATAYEFGGDLKKDLNQSFDWYMKAANQSHAPSQYKVGYFYENGFGVTKNKDTAMGWYKKAKANGSNQAKRRLNKKDYEKNEKAAKDKKLAVQAKLDKDDLARKAKSVVENKKLEKKQRAAVKKQAQLVTNKKEQKITAKKKATAKNIVVVRKKPALVKIPNMMRLVLNNKWKNKHGAADYLPSATTACLESADDELTCFSSEKIRHLSGAKVTYTAKSTIVGFKTSGSFKVIYNYNAIGINGAKSKSVGPYGLTMKEGWQEPAIAVKCQASDRKNITCFRGNKKIQFRR